jgi:hypothetical protein
VRIRAIGPYLKHSIKRVKSSRTFRSWLLFSFCIAASFIGIIVAIFVTKDPTDGGRGGAIATAAALYYLFLNKSYGRRLFEARTKIIPELIQSFERMGKITPSPESQKEIAETLSADLSNMFAREAGQQDLQNKFLAWATAIGTVVWGWGDIVTGWGMKLFHICIPTCTHICK